MPTDLANQDIPMDGVREYAEGYPVQLQTLNADNVYSHPEAHGRLAILAVNEGGHNCTQVDLLDLLVWVTRNRPDLVAETFRLTHGWAAGGGSTGGTGGAGGPSPGWPFGGGGGAGGAGLGPI